MKMATGEIIGAEELGGARIHANLTGLADQLAVDEYGSPTSRLSSFIQKTDSSLS